LYSLNYFRISSVAIIFFVLAKNLISQHGYILLTAKLFSQEISEISVYYNPLLASGHFYVMISSRLFCKICNILYTDRQLRAIISIQYYG